jgi:hypothetical protein
MRFEQLRSMLADIHQDGDSKPVLTFITASGHAWRGSVVRLDEDRNAIVLAVKGPMARIYLDIAAIESVAQ